MLVRDVQALARCMLRIRSHSLIFLRNRLPKAMMNLNYFHWKRISFKQQTTVIISSSYNEAAGTQTTTKLVKQRKILQNFMTEVDCSGKIFWILF